MLLAATEPELVEEIFDAARQLKRDVYGNRIVLFAPLYIGNDCTNDCQYCAFRRSNREQIRRTLERGRDSPAGVGPGEQGAQAADPRLRRASALRRRVHGRVRARTSTPRRRGHGEIRRVNINAAPLDHDGYATVKAAGIGTYQIFQETYHHETYRRVHPAGTRKGDYLWRLDGVARAMEAGVRRRGHRGLVRAVRLAVRGARAGEPRAALAEALQRAARTRSASRGCGRRRA